MNWLTKSVLPKIKAFVTQSDTKENLWYPKISVKINYNVIVGKTLTIEDLREMGFKAFFIANRNVFCTLTPLKNTVVKYTISLPSLL